MRTFDTIERNDQALSPRSFEQLIGNSPALEEALEHVKRVAPMDSTVLIQGETGTGKELIARAIHNISSRCGRPFIKLNCAAIPLDLLEPFACLRDRRSTNFTTSIHSKRDRTRSDSPRAGRPRMDGRGLEWRCREAWREAHNIDRQDAEVRAFAAYRKLSRVVGSAVVVQSGVIARPRNDPKHSNARRLQ